MRENNGSGTLLRRYIYGNSRISMTTPAGTFYYHTDGQSSVTNVTDSNGDKQWKYSYDPFGDERINRQISTTAPANPMRYTGEHLDNFTDTYHLRARQYDPHLGRFTQTDPKAASISRPYVSSYAYVANRPTVLIDPSGLSCTSSVAGAALAGAGYVASIGGIVAGPVTGGASLYFGVAGVLISAASLPLAIDSAVEDC